MTTASSEVPRDPSVWTDEHMFQLILHRLTVEEKVMPLVAMFGVWFSGLLNEKSRAIYDLEDHCIDAGGMTIPGIVISMTDDAVAWMRDTDGGRAAMLRICSLMEKPIYVENWERKLKA